MWELAKDLRVVPLRCIFLSLQHDHNFIFGPLYTKSDKQTAVLSNYGTCCSLVFSSSLPEIIPGREFLREEIALHFCMHFQNMPG